MTTIKIFTSFEQSRKLAEILPIESADMAYLYWINTDTKQEGIDTLPTILDGLPIDSCDIPCWSLSALLGVLPHIQEFYPFIEKINDKFVCRYKGSGIWTNGANPVDACYEMIIKLHELKML